MSKVAISKKNTILNGMSTKLVKISLDAFILALKGLKALVISYEKGWISEETCTESCNKIVDKLEVNAIKQGLLSNE